MPKEFKIRRNLLWAFGILLLFLVSLRLYSTLAMDSLPSPFTIEIDGSPITKAADGAEDRTQAKTGTDAAVFELKNSRLQCDDWILARSQAEDRSALPKQVMWFKADSDVHIHAVTATQNGDEYQLHFNSKCDVKGHWLLALLLTLHRCGLDGGRR
jgi:hypothetical protein